MCPQGKSVQPELLKGSGGGEVRQFGADPDAGTFVSPPVSRGGGGGEQHRLAGGHQSPGEPVVGDGGAMRALLVQQTRNSLPKIEIRKFGGDVIDYIPFVKKFDDPVCSKIG